MIYTVYHKNYAEVLQCRCFGLSTFWFVDVTVCRRFGLSTFWFVDVSVCRRFGLSTFRCVDVSVCRRFGLSTFRFVDVSVYRRFGCRRFGLSTFWLVTIQRETRENYSKSVDLYIRGMAVSTELFKMLVGQGRNVLVTSLLQRVIGDYIFLKNFPSIWSKHWIHVAYWYQSWNRFSHLGKHQTFRWPLLQLITWHRKGDN